MRTGALPRTHPAKVSAGHEPPCRQSPLPAANSDASAGNREVLRNIPHMLASDGTFASLIETIDILTAQEAVLFAMETAGEAMAAMEALYI